LARFLFWDYERGGLAYDLLVAAILLFLFLAPQAVFDDPLRRLR
jgi:hypothetical protein